MACAPWPSRDTSARPRPAHPRFFPKSKSDRTESIRADQRRADFESFEKPGFVPDNLGNNLDPTAICRSNTFGLEVLRIGGEQSRAMACEISTYETALHSLAGLAVFVIITLNSLILTCSAAVSVMLTSPTINSPTSKTYTKDSKAVSAPQYRRFSIASRKPASMRRSRALRTVSRMKHAATGIDSRPASHGRIGVTAGADA
jgi:hypothetical protein